MSYKYQKTDSYMDDKGRIWVVLYGQKAMSGFTQYAVINAETDATRWVHESDIDGCTK